MKPNWRQVEVEPTDEQLDCPCCDGCLTILSILKGCDHQVRIGHCPHCGHITYMDRPSAEWWKGFYNKQWDAAVRNPCIQASNHPVVLLAQTLPIDRTKGVIEIGCGWGKALLRMRKEGWMNVAGVEPSGHRREHCKLLGFFSVMATDEFISLWKPKLIYSIHTLEHTLEPLAILKTAAEAQSTGDYLILAVPNQLTEPIENIQLFLPHMHSFTPRSLVTLAGRCGYRLVADKSTNSEILMIFTRSSIKEAEDAPLPPMQDPPLMKDITFEGPIKMFVK